AAARAWLSSADSVHRPPRGSTAHAFWISTGGGRSLRSERVVNAGALRARARVVHTAGMPTQAELLSLADQVFVKNYRQQPIVLERGRGCEIWDVAGNRYLDMTAGIAVCGLGHAHPAFTARMAAQLGKLTQVSNLYFNDQQILAAKTITEH